MVCLGSLEDEHLAASTFDRGSDDFERRAVERGDISLFGPMAEEMTGANNFFDGVGCQRVEDDMLQAVSTTVAASELLFITIEGIHIVEPPIGRHNLQLIFRHIVRDKGERERDIEFVGEIALSEQTIGSESAGELQANTEARPETAAGRQFVVGGAAVMVRADSSASRHITLTHYERSDKERIVVMLFMGWEDETIADLATGDGRIVADDAIVDTSAEIDMDVLAQEKVREHRAVVDTRAEAHDAIAEGDTTRGDGRSLRVGVKDNVMDSQAVLDNRMRADATAARRESVVGESVETSEES